MASRTFTIKVYDRRGNAAFDKWPKGNLAFVVAMLREWVGKAIVHVEPPLSDWERRHVTREVSRG